MQGATIEVDALWREVRPWGRFQVFQLAILLLDSAPASFAILSAVFTGYIPEFECSETVSSAVDGDDNVTATSHELLVPSEDQCSYSIQTVVGNDSIMSDIRQCGKFSYENTHSYASEWNLVCSRANLAALAQSLVLAGQGLGAFIMSHLADKFGRKKIHVISHICVMVTMIVMAFSQNIYMLLALRLVAGTFQQGIVCTGKILLLEMFPRESRSHTEAASFLSWSVGMMILTVYGYLFRNINWRYLQLALAAFSVYSLAEWWIIDESMRWLITNSRIKEAKHVLKKAAKWNKVDFVKAERVFNEYIPLETNRNQANEESENAQNGGFTAVTNNDNAAKEDVKKYNVIDILKNPALRINTFILWYSWIVATGTYYGMTLVSSHLAGDRFVNFFLSAVIEVPSLLLEFYLFNKIGRKKTLIFFFAVAGLSLIVSTVMLTVFDNNAAQIVATIFSLLGKSASTGCFSTVFLYTPEIYPTNYRNSGLGVASSISRIGGILAPFASNLALIALWIPGAIFSAMCLLVVLLATRLPESAEHELPTTIAECNEWEDKPQTDTPIRL